ncbi:hypothetical protein [Spirillospora sp. NPDC029432]|uniref:hypothetical protein n=1 Tax=Spirillospora sp. NPDC029432 TaxID=3154599 RepID=UPI0034556E07
MTLAALAPTASARSDTAPAPGEPVTVTADELPTWQTDGVVLSIAMVGDTVYVGGNFDHIRPPGTAPGDPQEQPRANLAAFNAATGQPLAWDPAVESNPGQETEVRDIDAAPDGRTLYIAGKFTKVNGLSRPRIASFTLPDGSLTTFRHDVSAAIEALTVSPTTVYAGGHFTSVGTAARQRLAAFDTTTGALTAWAPTADRPVHALTMSPDGGQVVIGGKFDLLNGNPPHGLGAVYADNGTSAPWETGVDYVTETRMSWVTDLVTDHDTVYASAAGQSTFDGRLAVEADGGRLRWIDQCLGGTEAITLLDGVLYSGSHAHDCSSQPDGFPELHPNYQRLLAEPARPTGDTPPILHWFPVTNSGAAPYNQGPRAMDNNGDYLWIGGDFTTVNKRPQQSLTRFAPLRVSADVNTPEALDAPTVTGGTSGSLKVDWTQTWDRDNRRLKYEVIRDGTTVVHTAESASRYWDLQPMTFADTGLAPGSSHTYSVRVTDPFGNSTRSPQSTPAQAG